jgi:hypothetical protein
MNDNQETNIVDVNTPLQSPRTDINLPIQSINLQVEQVINSLKDLDDSVLEQVVPAINTFLEKKKEIKKEKTFKEAKDMLEEVNKLGKPIYTKKDVCEYFNINAKTFNKYLTKTVEGMTNV